MQKGQHCSPEFKQRLRISSTGYRHTEAARAKMRANAPKTHTPEQNAKISRALTGRVFSDSHRAAIKNAWVARRLRGVSEETRAKQRLAQRGRKQTPEAIAKTVAFHKGRKRSQEMRDRQREMWRQMPVEAVRRRTGPGLVAACRANPSSLERAIAVVLEGLGIKYEAQVSMGHRFIVDFYIAEKQLIIECDGEYWHGRPGAPERDRRKDAWLASQGYRVIRLTEVQIRTDAYLATIGALA